jgi:hypothetical protein
MKGKTALAVKKSPKTSYLKTLPKAVLHPASGIRHPAIITLI